jgi:ammonia channel protein AmtB
MANRKATGRFRKMAGIALSAIGLGGFGASDGKRLRVDPEHESRGLDLSQHGEAGYNM